MLEFLSLHTDCHHWNWSSPLVQFNLITVFRPTNDQKTDIRIYNSWLKYILIIPLLITAYASNSQLEFNTWNVLSYRL